MPKIVPTRFRQSWSSSAEHSVHHGRRRPLHCRL